MTTHIIRAMFVVTLAFGCSADSSTPKEPATDEGRPTDSDTDAADVVPEEPNDGGESTDSNDDGTEDDSDSITDESTADDEAASGSDSDADDTEADGGSDVSPEPDPADGDSGSDPGEEASDGDSEVDDSEPSEAPGPTDSTNLIAGGLCDCDDECGTDGICVYGVCQIRADGDCSSAGSQLECPEGSRCWALSGSEGSAICWADCDSVSCEGSCDSDGSCVPNQSTSCDASCGTFCEETSTDGDLSDPSDDASTTTDPVGPSPVDIVGVGQGCVNSVDCPDGLTCATNGYPGGYCSVLDCGSGGCPQESDCYITEEDQPTMCLGFCSSDTDCRLGYSCFDPGVCYPNGSGGSGAERCTPSSCPADEICTSSGICVEQAPDFPSGAKPNCQGVGPDFTQCSTNGGNNACSDLVIMDPRRTDSYWDYPLNGETQSNQYRSYLRRDLALLLKYASDQTHCLSQNWNFGNGEPIGLGDMSEADGAIPGTAEGDPGHPEGSHTDGFDIDIGYYQIGIGDNLLRPICDHIINGQDQYHCTGPAETLDVWRTALYLGKLHDSPYLRVIGVDGQAGPAIIDAGIQLCAAGYLEGSACDTDMGKVTYETENEGMGWFYFHHHHFHVSLSAPSAGFNQQLFAPRTLSRDGLFHGYHGVFKTRPEPRKVPFKSLE